MDKPLSLARRQLLGAAVAGGVMAQFSRLAAAQVLPPEALLGPDKLRRGLAWPAPQAALALWPAPPAGARNPVMKERVEETSESPDKHFRRVNQITQPRLSVFPASNPNGSAMLIIPGGGFIWNYFDHEGYLLAEFLNSHGVTAFVLFYRLAGDGWDRPADVGIADAQRAMRVIRSRAQQFAIDPARVGVIGFSAGGFLTASLQTRHADAIYQPVDAADSLSARPFLAAPIYPVQSLDPAIAYKDAARVLFNGALGSQEIAAYSPDRNVDKDSAPGFFVHAADDYGVPIANSSRLAGALREKGVAAELHEFATGGHGFGYLRPPAGPIAIWPELFLGFARSQGLMGPSS